MGTCVFCERELPLAQLGQPFAWAPVVRSCTDTSSCMLHLHLQVHDEPSAFAQYDCAYCMAGTSAV